MIVNYECRHCNDRYEGRSECAEHEKECEKAQLLINVIRGRKTYDGYTWAPTEKDWRYLYKWPSEDKIVLLELVREFLKQEKKLDGKRKKSRATDT